jgi:hypothetical protein
MRRTAHVSLTMNPPNDNAEALRSALHVANTAFCATGDIPISQNDPIKLFFQGPADEHRGRNDAKTITFPRSSSDDVNLLLDACKQASFGRGGEEFLDPSYRKALVPHAPSFAIAPAPAIDPCGLGILSKIRQTLLTGASLAHPMNLRRAARKRGVSQLAWIS